MGVWEKCSGPQRRLHLRYHLGDRETRILSVCGLARVKHSKTAMLPNETQGLARAGKGIQDLKS